MLTKFCKEMTPIEIICSHLAGHARLVFSLSSLSHRGVSLREKKSYLGGRCEPEFTACVSQPGVVLAHTSACTVWSELAFLLTVQQTHTKTRSRFAAQLTHTLAEIRLVKLH